MAPTGIRTEEVSNAAYFKTETKYFANNQNNNNNNNNFLKNF